MQVFNYDGEIVVGFLNLNTRLESEEITGLNGVSEKYAAALRRAKPFGGRKFHNRRFGGGIAFPDIDSLNRCCAAIQEQDRLDLRETAKQALIETTDFLEESHRDEIENDHFGDGLDGCSYCSRIARNRKIIERLDKGE